MAILEFSVNVVLALAALVIAIFQWKEERRFAKEEKEEQQARAEEKLIVEEIVRQIGQIERCSEGILRFQEAMEQSARRQDNDPDAVAALFDQMLEQYEKDFQTVSPMLQLLYEELLQNEERFPMSHGYGRYIVELRAILDFRTVVRQRRNNDYDSMRIRFHQILTRAWNEGGTITPEYATELGHLTEQMIRSLEPYYKHAQTIAVLVHELKIKYQNA